MADIKQLVKDYQDKRKALASVIKGGSKEVELMSNTTDFRNKGPCVSVGEFTSFSSNIQIENWPSKNYPYKCGVKLKTNQIKANEIHYGPHVEPGGGDNLYGICVDIDDYTERAQVVPITSGAYQAWLFAKDSTIKRGDKVKFNDKGEAEKSSGSNTVYNAFALEDTVTLSENTYLVHIKFVGNKVSNN
ncbi:DUF228 domain-containing protein [Borrelia persica]|uniref:DUF228 domain-containing protein n=1 Tax=Borrelia persica TaxID=44448 RepID=UPI000463867E|nr:DUF228 domain-containing protein [Borrelia persica]